MPTLSSMRIPPPKDWDEFEEITLSCLKIKWTSQDLRRHGRKGQRQRGVDLYGHTRRSRLVGVQCKLSSEPLSEAVIADEVSKAEGFRPQLSAFYIATTLPRDATLQRIVRLMSEDRVKHKRFSVDILFWEDLIQELTKDSAEFKKHYPQLLIAGEVPEERSSRQLALFDLPYNGLCVRAYMSLMFGECGMMANQDPTEFKGLMAMISGSASVVLSQPEYERLSGYAVGLADYCLALMKRERIEPEDWKQADELAISIEQLVGDIEYGLRGKELALYKLGERLGRWNMKAPEDWKMTSKFRNGVLKLIGIILPGSPVSADAEKLMDQYDKSNRLGSVDIPHKVYNAVREGIVWSEIATASGSSSSAIEESLAQRHGIAQIYYLNVPRLAMFIAAHGISIDIPSAEGIKDLTSLGIELNRLIIAIESGLARVPSQPVLFAKMSLQKDIVGSTMSFKASFRTKNIPTLDEYESGRFMIRGDLKTDPYIYRKGGTTSLILPVDPKWFTTRTSFADFRHSGGTLPCAGLFTVKRLDDQNRSIIGTPLIIGIPTSL